MKQQRSERVAEEVKRLLSEAIRSEIKDPRMPALAVVTEVKVNRDLSLATVYVSTLGESGDKQDMMECLQQAKGFLRTFVARNLNLRVALDLRFRLDESLEEAMRMSRLIDDVRARDRERELELHATAEADAADRQESPHGS